MNFNYELIDSVKSFIEGAKLEEISIGCSDSQVFKINKEENTYFLKVSKKGILTKEYEKLKWLEGKLLVPKIELYESTDENEYLITESLEGEMVCSDYYLNNPDEGIKVIVEAFKNIYSVNINNCPFDTSINYKLELVENNVKNNLLDIDIIDKKVLDKFGSVENILKFLQDNKFYDELCFSHGDMSLPNVFASKDKFTGFIDVGECGKADKWFDLAICEKSIRRNYGEEYVQKFYDELGIKPEREKIDYYILIMELYL